MVTHLKTYVLRLLLNYSLLCFILKSCELPLIVLQYTCTAHKSSGSRIGCMCKIDTNFSCSKIGASISYRDLLLLNHIYLASYCRLPDLCPRFDVLLYALNVCELLLHVDGWF